MKKLALGLFVLALGACSGTGLLPVTSGQGDTTNIPRVILNCQTSQCRTNATSPLINVIFTTSSCSDPLFGGVVSSSTRSISCSSLSGCYGEMSGWTGTSGATSTMASGTYNLCACIDYTGAGTPWVNCRSLGQKNNVAVNSGTGLQSITSWADQ